MLPVHNKLELQKKRKLEAFTPDLSVHVCITVHTQCKGAFSLTVEFHHHDNLLFGGID